MKNKMILLGLFLCVFVSLQHISCTTDKLPEPMAGAGHHGSPGKTQAVPGIVPKQYSGPCLPGQPAGFLFTANYHALRGKILEALYGQNLLIFTQFGPQNPSLVAVSASTPSLYAVSKSGFSWLKMTLLVIEK